MAKLTSLHGTGTTKASLDLDQIDQSALLALRRALESSLEGKSSVIELCMIALLAAGHILIEDVPGVGKTTLARSIALAVGGELRRVQFTSDLLPSDVLGVSVYDAKTSSFHLKKGPIFTNVLIADEINRASPRTQSALLEAMNEGNVTLEGETLELPKPFFVIATQNPQDFSGTYPLPESQLDRFLMRICIGYPPPGVEARLLMGNARTLKREPATVLSPNQLIELQKLTDQVFLDASLASYLISIVQATRSSPHVALGASTRAALALSGAAKARALLQGRHYCIADDIYALSVPVLAHRLRLKVFDSAYLPDLRASENLVKEVVAHVPVPI